MCIILVEYWCLPAYTVEGYGFLTQASMSRLGEISSNSTILPARAVAQAMSSSFEREHFPLRRGGLSSTRVRDSATIPLFEPSPKRDPSV